MCAPTFATQKAFGYGILEMGALATSSMVCVTYVITQNWIANNVIAISFSIWAIEIWIQTKFWQVLIIFIGLMAYDVFFVFGTDVMITVAKSFQSPMKILIPSGASTFSMIGLGDIVIPGLLVSLCLRLDFVRELIAHSKKIPTEEHRYHRYKYFITSLFSYTFGLILTQIVVKYTKKP